MPCEDCILRRAGPVRQGFCNIEFGDRNRSIKSTNKLHANMQRNNLKVKKTRGKKPMLLLCHEQLTHTLPLSSCPNHKSEFRQSSAKLNFVVSGSLVEVKKHVQNMRKSVPRHASAKAAVEGLGSEPYGFSGAQRNKSKPVRQCVKRSPTFPTVS